MRARRAWRALALAIGAGFLSCGPLRGVDEPVAVLERGVSEVLAEVYDNPGAAQPPSKRLRPILERYFDFEGITRRALGPGGRKFTPEQFQRATELFSELVLRTYADRFEPKERPVITHGAKVQLSPTRVELPTMITYAGQNYAVAYRMENKGEAWRIYDVIIEGVSMISNYRAQFDELLQKGGPPQVLRSLEENLQKSAEQR
jgi:phospholipid transport system substrate-binding protein